MVYSQNECHLPWKGINYCYTNNTDDSQKYAKLEKRKKKKHPQKADQCFLEDKRCIAKGHR